MELFLKCKYKQVKKYEVKDIQNLNPSLRRNVFLSSGHSSMASFLGFLPN